MSLPLFRPILLASVLALAGAAQAATMTAPVDASGNFTVTDTTGPGTPRTYSFRIDPTTAPTPSIYYDNSVPDQSVADIKIDIAAAYSTTAARLSTASTCDSFNCPGATASSTQLTLRSVSPFDYLAVNFGANELFFHWASPIQNAVLTAVNGFPEGLTNYRSYLTTPVPGALALFLGALGFLGLRRKVVQPRGAEPMAA
ncbi:PEP-CTERM sorting domain-containing protein [Ramlibacter ginsenosidimutans]|uniref:PEP-CTERM sorting domain-containing protein n=1 Tax=Ramlibacter ginsenosidimutans TaxID=502333 RepID=A0A934WLI9_9BURK|nr:PEP-CTERM sorting domain-containing protein [Ramlibacter ginsenosidimutans]MBK6005147.1 PEP-CTERM sorting domain-containing protein [Ramlibacter ginsenosidimutans]